MMLALIGSGEYLEPMREVDRELLDLFEAPPRVVCLPTAAGTEGDATIDDWMHRGVDHFTELGAETDGVRVWDRATAESVELAERVEAADFVYLSGGNPGYLHETLADSAVWRSIVSVIEGGGLLAGCSAGAMIQGEWFMGGLRPRPGFALWPDVQVIPHFDEIPTAVAAAARLAVGRERTVVGVNANTAVVQSDGGYRVIGDEATVWTRDGRTVHRGGETIESLSAPPT